MYIVEKGFSGIISAHKGQVIEIKDNKIVKDLINAGYIKEYKDNMQNNEELLKDNSSLKKEIEDLKIQIENLNNENSNLKEEKEKLELSGAETEETKEKK